MVVAIVCGLGASYMTSRLLAERDDGSKQEAPQEIPKVKILVAKTNLDHGAAIKNPQEMFVEKTIPQEGAPKDALTDVKLLKGKFLKRQLRKDDHITSEDLVDEKTSLLANLPDGYRGVGVQVTNDGTASGFASLPGSKVDILWTIKRNDSNSFVKILIADVLVLAADTKNTADQEGKAMPASIVTLALKQVDAMKIDLAKRHGTLTFVVRRLGDTTPPPEIETYTDKMLFASKLDLKKNGKVPSGDKENADGTDDPVTGIPELKNGQKVEPPAPKRFFYVVNIRHGNVQTRQVIEVDAKGRPIVDDDLPPDAGPPPALDAQPQGTPQGPAAPEANKNDEKKSKD